MRRVTLLSRLNSFPKKEAANICIFFYLALPPASKEISLCLFRRVMYEIQALKQSHSRALA